MFNINHLNSFLPNQSFKLNSSIYSQVTTEMGETWISCHPQTLKQQRPHKAT